RLSGLDDDARREVRRRAPRTPSTAATDPQLVDLRAQLTAHPCADCPEVESHLRWVERWRRSRTELSRVHRRIQGRTSSLARQFDQLTDLLRELGYLVATEDGQLHPSDRGLRLRRLFSDRDLLIAECIEHGAWTGLDAAGLAAVVSAAV